MPTNTGNMDTEKILELSEQHSIVFFDGVCGLCNTVVDWVMKKDAKARFRFTPLQGATAALILSPADREQLDTIVVLKNSRVFRRSDAIVEILLDLKQPWLGLGWVLRFIPPTLRNLGYSWVAATRYRLFGKRDVCRLPTPEERKRFLD